jgi:hypothetical protein
LSHGRLHQIQAATVLLILVTQVVRFKDLYLSGGVVFNVAGGTGTSTSGTLDDYEEGTFTATLTSAVAPTSPPTTSGRYTKIGRSVTISIFLEDGDTSGGSGVMRIDGLPFEAGAAVGINRGSGPVHIGYNMTVSGDWIVLLKQRVLQYISEV